MKSENKRSIRPLVATASLALVLAIAPGALSDTQAPKPPGASSAQAPQASAQPSASAAPSAAPQASAPAAGYVAAPAKKQPPGPPPPTPAQIAALAELQQEADLYEKNAKDYRSTITRIVQQHYEDRRKRILSALDSEIATERKGLRDAREEAIRRLEAFVAKYSGPNAHPENTPDAMFRLAALYEERAENDSDSMDDQVAARRPAIALYKRIIKEFPNYRELAAIYYYLGHALNDSSRIPEAQQVWRSLVCHNHYSYPVPVDPKDPERDTLAKLPQDHDRDFWTGWENRHPTPPGYSAAMAKPTTSKKAAPPPRAPAKGKAVKGKKVESEEGDDEMTFVNPYPNDCQPIPQKTLPGQAPRYIPEIWWAIGDYHFNEVDPNGGPYNFNRAEAAYQHSIGFKKQPVYSVSMYKLAWTYFKQQRYETSVREFIDLLRETDAQEKATGDPGTDFRTEAYTYIAGSLTYFDFQGPSGTDPYIPRNDIIDLETDPHVAEQKMHIAIDRVQDPKLIPQNEKWTVEVYKALAQEFKDLNQYHNDIEVSQLILQKWPMNCDAPVVQSQIADIYDTLTAQSRDGTPERAKNSAAALEARTKLSSYVGLTPWTEACKDNPEALQTAERLVRGGLRRAAADHTNRAAALVDQALATNDADARAQDFERALAEYRLAAQGWQGYLTQDENAPDAYESRYWLGDANHKIIVIEVAQGKVPSKAEIEASRRTNVAVRDSNEDDKYLQPAAFNVVDTAQQVLNAEYKAHDKNGTQGIELRKELKLIKNGDNVKVVSDPLPPEVIDAVRARDEYVARVPPEKDVAPEAGVSYKNSNLYRFDAADFFFLYGQFDEAKKRMDVIWKEECGKTPFGGRAWVRLLTMANTTSDVEAGRALADAQAAHPCSTGEEGKKEAEMAGATRARGYYVDAAKAYEVAEKMKDGPERVAAWRKAGDLYKEALQKAPARDEAPEAAMNGAFAYKQIGDYDQAIAMYSLFIREYGNEENLNKLEKGDPANNKPADPKRYEERKKYLKDAYDALSQAYVLFFNYRQAADTYDTISRNKRFEKAARRDAARNAVVLYANIGDRDKMQSTRATFFDKELDAPADQKADIDYLIASADLKAWDEHGADEGANRTAREKAIGSMEGYFNANKGNAAAAQYLVDAAYHAAKMLKAGGEGKAGEWCKNTMGAFDKYKNSAQARNKDGKNIAMGSQEADMAAECAYTALDAKIKADWDYDTGHHRYDGVVDKVKTRFEDDVKKANDTYYKQLDDIIKAYESRPWSVAARARQGSLYDSVRSGLYNARPPGLKLYTDKEEKILKMAETSDREDLQEKADAIRQSRRELWRQVREREIDDADKAMVKFYVEAWVWAKAWKVRNASVDYAIQRLAFYTDIIGDAKLNQFSQGVVDPISKQPFVYTDGIFLRSRPGQTPPLTNDGMPAPLPVVP